MVLTWCLQVNFINSHLGVAFPVPIVMLDHDQLLSGKDIARIIGAFGKEPSAPTACTATNSCQFSNNKLDILGHDIRNLRIVACWGGGCKEPQKPSTRLLSSSRKTITSDVACHG